MDGSSPQRPAHRRQRSSKSNILRSLVSARARGEEATAGSTASKQGDKSQQDASSVEHNHLIGPKPRALGERQGNVQSPPSSPSKARSKGTPTPNTNGESRKIAIPSQHEDPVRKPKRPKSATNLSAVFARMNRSNKDVSTREQGDKENTTPPTSSHGPPIPPPIWSQLNTTAESSARPGPESTRPQVVDMDDANRRQQDYPRMAVDDSRDFRDHSQSRPVITPRPKTTHFEGCNMLSATDRPVSGEANRKSVESGQDRKRLYGSPPKEHAISDRKVSDSSTEQPAKEKLTLAKRGGRVMAAVAAFQDRKKPDAAKDRETPALGPKDVDQAFEAVLDSRNVPEAMRHKMRALTLRVKTDFIRQDQGTSLMSPTGVGRGSTSTDQSSVNAGLALNLEESKNDTEDKSTKRSRARSRTFNFSKSDKKGDRSPTKKRRSQSKSRQVSSEDSALSSALKGRSPRNSFDRKGAGSAMPADFLLYLRQHQDPVTIEVGRLHKLRILLRNETVAWVDSFVLLGGMAEIVGLLHRILQVEWREEHEDCLLHEALLCLKGLCTTERAMSELDKVADELFPSLVRMLYDEEKKGPAEYSTRTIITSILFNFLASTKDVGSTALESRARRVLAYVGEPKKPEEARPVDFVLDMRAPRPYKLWCREVGNVTKEVFWIFLHHVNVVPLTRPTTATSTPSCTDQDRNFANDTAGTFAQRHFPGLRPPVPAAPYIGGVEWDATTYITSHLDLLNGVVASLPSTAARNDLRAELQASGFENILGATLRTCKEKFYAGVHDGLRSWVAAAAEDGWDTRFVREGPTREEQIKSYSPRKSPNKKPAAPPQLEAVPKLSLGNKDGAGAAQGEDDGWL